MELSSFDKSLLNLLQGNIPVCSRPFAEMASTLGADENFVLERVRELKAAGYLRRIGTFFNSDNLGYRSTLIALEVTPSEICTVAETINGYDEVTHNYEREGKFNLWFTLSTLNAEREGNILSEIKSLRGVEDMINLKSNRKFKINVQFNLQ
ncbi:MAG: AsnC family transcriptional regulator [Selenomonadaceae bacterium]|nr:AsnC family transcriptional regulator [Selenomonadaceae bacterium]